MSYSNLKSVIENISTPQDWVSAASLLRKFPSNIISEGQAKTIYSALIQAAGTVSIPKNRMMLLRSSIASFVKATKQVAPVQEVRMLRQRFLMGQKTQLQKQDLNYLQGTQQKTPQNIRKAVNPNNNVVALKNQHSSVRPILQIIVKKNNPSKMNQIHNSLGILESYSRQHMKRGFSSTTFQPGSHYLGVKQSKQYGQTILIPHEQISRLPPKTPDIEANFKWYAGNSINKWNQFVTAESKFRKFVDSISNSQKIQNYYVTQIAKSTRLTWAAQVLATCIYYYYHLPMIKLLTSTPSITTVQMSSAIFQNYQIGTKNPLGLSDQQGLKLLILIFNPVLQQDQQPILSIHSTVIDLMNQMNFSQMGRQAKQNGEYMKNYLIQRQGICSQYYAQQGIDPQIIQKSLSKPVAYDIKFMQSPLPSLEQNQYLKAKMLQVIDSDKNVNPEKELKTWNYTWNSQKYPCYDYLFS